jgi:WD40 repeat protein
MPLKFNCPQCRKEIISRDELAGKQGRCPGCKNVLSIPQEEPPQNRSLPEQSSIHSGLPINPSPKSHVTEAEKRIAPRRSVEDFDSERDEAERDRNAKRGSLKHREPDRQKRASWGIAWLGVTLVLTIGAAVGVGLWLRMPGTAAPTLRATLRGHASPVNSVAFSPDGKTLASGGFGQVLLWNVQTGREQASLKGHTGKVFSITFSPDGKILASGAQDKTIKLWDLATNTEQATLQGHTQEALCVAFSPDGKTLASGSFQELKLWDVQTGKERESLQGHTHLVNCVAFSPDGKTLASGGGEFDKPGELKLWDVQTGQEQASLKGPGTGFHGVAFSPDGKTLALACGNTILLWDVKTKRERATLKGHTGTVYTVAYSPDGKTLASGSDDNRIKLWDEGK